MQPLLALQAASSYLEGSTVGAQLLLDGSDNTWKAVLCYADPYTPGTRAQSFRKHLCRAHAVPGQALSTEGKGRASAPSGLCLQQKQPAPWSPREPANGQASHASEVSWEHRGGKEKRNHRSRQRLEKVSEDVESPVRSYRAEGEQRKRPEKAGSCKPVCCALGIGHSFCVGRGEPGKVGGAIVGCLSRRPYQGPNLSSLLPTSPPPPVPGFQPVNSHQDLDTRLLEARASLTEPKELGRGAGLVF